MKANDSISSSMVDSNYRRLFSEPSPYGSKSVRKTELFCLETDDSGNSVVVSRCIEDEMVKQIDMNYHDVTLSNLISKGVDPHSLDLIDSSKLGVDEGIDRLAKELISNSSKYINNSNSEPSI